MENNIDYKFNEIAAKTIKKHREEKGLSLEEVVKKMKNPISRQSLFKYENNLSRMKNSTFNDICNSLGVNPLEVYNEINKSLIYSSGIISKEIDWPVDIPLVDNYGKIIHGKVFGKEGILETENDLEIIDYILEKKQPDEIDLLYSKYKDRLSEKDKEHIKFIINQAKNEFENKKGDGN